MADKSMKAVIQVDVDPKGAVKGVTAVERELAKMNKFAKKGSTAAGISAALSSIEQVSNILRTVGNAMQERFKMLDENAVKFNADAAAARAQSLNDIMQSNVRIANATAQGSIETSQAQADVKRGEAIRMESEGSGVSGGMGATARLTANLGAITDIYFERLSMSLNALSTGDLKNVIQFGAGNDFLNSSNYAYKNESPGRGMQGSKEQSMSEEYLRQIAANSRAGK